MEERERFRPEDDNLNNLAECVTVLLEDVTIKEFLTSCRTRMFIILSTGVISWFSSLHTTTSF
jgi:hypothetical protein